MSEKPLAENKASLELSILMPCLNEAETLQVCIEKAQGFLKEYDVRGEVLIADNGSTDGSQEIAKSLGARLVHVKNKGYGSALIGGIEAAYGKYVIMGDADDSYDFTALMPFVEKLREGYDLVMGNRFKGGIAPGAMPKLHKYLGNPVLSAIGKIFYRCPANDFHCGLRGFSKDAAIRMKLRTPGMEFASEMVVKATMLKMSISEVPTTLSPDGRSRPPHLRSWRDGWRHLKFLFMFSPLWLYFIPSTLLILTSTFIFAALLMTAPGKMLRLEGLRIGDHWMVIAGGLFAMGYTGILFGILSLFYSVKEGYRVTNPSIERLRKIITIENSVMFGLFLLLSSLTIILFVYLGWRAKGYGGLSKIREMVVASTLMAVGLQTILVGFLLSMIGMDTVE